MTEKAELIKKIEEVVKEIFEIEYDMNFPAFINVL